ncbi:hypothetical protein HZS_1539 [Henneguya salminicola]|nr:hypothetical protein HZS_1539 [Henneguya salminicola]
MTFVTLSTDIIYTIDKRKNCIKCLYTLSANKEACQIISQFSQFFTEKLPLTITSHAYTDHATAEYDSFCKLSSLLIHRINHLFIKCYQLPCDDLAKNIFNSNISYEPSELLQLIYEHLRQTGFENSAKMLQHEISIGKEISVCFLKLTQSKQSVNKITHDRLWTCLLRTIYLNNIQSVLIL